jgi:transcriptional regulator with XRE-family HTH domain
MKKININDITFGSSCLRRHNSDADYVTEKMVSLEKDGLLNPFTVAVVDGGYAITDGSIRLTALKRYYKENGRLPEKVSDDGETIMLPVIEGADEEKILQLQITGNASVKRTTNKEFINAIYQLAMSGNLSLEEIAKNTGMSVAWVNSLLKTLRLGDDVIKAAEEKKVSLSNLISLSKLANVIDEEEMEEWVNKAANTNTSDFAPAIEERVIEIRASGGKKEKEFVLKERLMKKDDIILFFANVKRECSENPTDENQIRLQIMKELFQCDSKSEAQLRQQYEEKKQAAKDAVAARRKKRELELLEEISAEELKKELEKRNN